MLEARRYRRAADHLAARLAGEARRALPLARRCRPTLRRTNLADAGAVYDPRRLGAALGGLLRVPPKLDLAARHRPARSRSPSASTHLRALLRARRRARFDEAVRGADRVTVAVTLFALLELYKQGEATWTQDDAVRRHRDRRARVRRRAARRRPWRVSELAQDRRGAAVPHRPTRSPRADLAEAAELRASTSSPTRWPSSIARTRPASAGCSSSASPAASRSRPIRSPRRPRGGCWPSRARRR